MISTDPENPASDPGNGLCEVTQQAEPIAFAFSLSPLGPLYDYTPTAGVDSLSSLWSPCPEKTLLFEVSWLQDVSCLQPRFPYFSNGRQGPGVCDALTPRANSKNCSWGWARAQGGRKHTDVRSGSWNPSLSFIYCVIQTASFHFLWILQLDQGLNSFF